MTHHLKTALILSAFALSGCVTERMTDDGKQLPPEWNAPPNEDLPLSTDGHFLCTVTRIVDPVTVVVNKNNPKTLHFIGVLPPSKDEHPEAYEEAKLYLWEYIGKLPALQSLHFLVQSGTDPRADDLYGRPLLVDETLAPGHYKDVLQGMLSKGLLRIGDPREFQDDRVAAEMVKREQEARSRKVGIWKFESKAPSGGGR